MFPVHRELRCEHERCAGVFRCEDERGARFDLDDPNWERVSDGDRAAILFS